MKDREHALACSLACFVASLPTSFQVPHHRRSAPHQERKVVTQFGGPPDEHAVPLAHHGNATAGACFAGLSCTGLFVGWLVGWLCVCLVCLFSWNSIGLVWIVWRRRPERLTGRLSSTEQPPRIVGPAELSHAGYLRRRRTGTTPCAVCDHLPRKFENPHSRNGCLASSPLSQNALQSSTSGLACPTKRARKMSSRSCTRSSAPSCSDALSETWLHPSRPRRRRSCTSG